MSLLWRRLRDFFNTQTELQERLLQLHRLVPSSRSHQTHPSERQQWRATRVVINGVVAL